MIIQGDTKKEHVKNVNNFCIFFGTSTQFQSHKFEAMRDVSAKFEVCALKNV